MLICMDASRRTTIQKKSLRADTGPDARAAMIPAGAAPAFPYQPGAARLASPSRSKKLAGVPRVPTPSYKAYSVALGQARKSIHLTVAYVAPDVQILDQILKAARRGLDVEMIFPASRTSASRSMPDAPSPPTTC
jgi:phosphatidylserine/phosphatidylglycerophosphate/cardiolipin synthase-like enzyme